MLVLTVCWHLAAGAADTLPSYLPGRWNTSESVGAGDIRQTEMVLATDGFGLVTGASPLMARMQGMDKAGRKLSSIPYGMPMRVMLDSTTQEVRIVPHERNGVLAAGRSTFSCSVDPAGPTLTCVLNDGGITVWHRFSETMSCKDAATITTLRRHFP